mgnify:CR=1 FL=1
MTRYECWNCEAVTVTADHDYPELAPINDRRYRLLVLRAALAMEIHGLRRRGKSAAQIVREEFGIKKRRRVDVYFAFCRKVKLDPSARICAEYLGLWRKLERAEVDQ